MVNPLINQKRSWEANFNTRFQAVRASLRSLQLQAEESNWGSKTSHQVQHRILFINEAWAAINQAIPPEEEKQQGRKRSAESGGRAP